MKSVLSVALTHRALSGETSDTVLCHRSIPPRPQRSSSSPPETGDSLPQALCPSFPPMVGNMGMLLPSPAGGRCFVIKAIDQPQPTTTIFLRSTPPEADASLAHRGRVDVWQTFLSEIKHEATSHE